MSEPLSFADFQQMYKAEFKLVANNSLPLDVSIQGYFLDEGRAGAVI